METRKITLCTAELSHKDFLRQLYIECHPEFDFISNLSQAQKEDILFQQFLMEETQLKQIYPNAQQSIVMLDHECIGKLYVNYGAKENRILEIGLMERFRGEGIGKEIVTTVIERALPQEKTVTLQVAWFNKGAYRFYEKLGFQATEDKGAYYDMMYMP